MQTTSVYLNHIAPQQLIDTIFHIQTIRPGTQRVIFGVGTDVVELSRIQATYDRFGEHFVRRVLMEQELELFLKCLANTG